MEQKNYLPILTLAVVCGLLVGLFITLSGGNRLTYSPSAQVSRRIIPLRRPPIKIPNVQKGNNGITKNSPIFDAQENCNYKSQAFIRESINNNGKIETAPLTYIPDMFIHSTIRYADGNPLYSEPFVFPIDKLTGASDKVDVQLPNNQQNAGYADVRLALSDRVKNRFDIVEQFCTPTGDTSGLSSCPSVLDDSDTIKGFRLNCGTSIEYGWIVKRKPYVLNGDIKVEARIIDYPGFEEHFKTEICDKNDVVGGDCTEFIGNNGSIYGAASYELAMRDYQPYQIGVLYNLTNFLSKFEVQGGSDTRKQTVSLNSFAHQQHLGLPIGWVVDYEGCTLFKRDDKPFSPTAIFPYRCQLEVDELDGFSGPVRISAYVN